MDTKAELAELNAAQRRGELIALSEAKKSAYEFASRLRRRPIPAKVVNGVQLVFICLLLLFMGYVLFKDFARFRGNRDLAAEEKIGRFLYTPEFLALRDVSFARADEEAPVEK